ncbi:MAG: spore germination protein [Clostridia bacterium]|nr:spore germination protein [Clostridia bacterium]
MAHWIRKFLHTSRQQEYSQPLQSPKVFYTSLAKNMEEVHNAYKGCEDLIVREFAAGNHSFVCLSLGNMVDKGEVNRMLLEKLQWSKGLKKNPLDCFLQIEKEISTSPDQKRIYNFDQLYEMLATGFAVLLTDGVEYGLALGIQMFPYRTISSPQNEVMERGSQEAFTEVLKLNVPLLRRRLKTPDLAIESVRIGGHTKTEVAVCYLRGVASDKIVKQIHKRLKAITIDTVLESGYIQPFLEDNSLSLFSSIGVTERPDTVCAKLTEGRVVLLVDGSPFCLITPYLFSEHFQNMDDYTLNPFYATFIRLLKYLSFFLAILLPGMYVAIGEHNPEVLPSAIFFKVVDAEVSTPFSLLWEALIIHTIYEIMREAGLRLPKAVGHAVSIVGALVIGDAAVTAGLIGAPMIIVVAVTALSSYVIPSLYYPAAVLRFAIIFVGGIAGLFGVVLLLALVLLEIASLEPYGIPVSAPISPFDRTAMRDTFARAGWKTLAKRKIKVQNLHGTDGDVL